MKKFLLAAALLLTLFGPAGAQTRTTASCSAISWTYGIDNLGQPLAIDQKGRLCLSGDAGGVAANQIQGNVDHNAVDTGTFPIKIGGVGSSTAPTAITTGRRTNGWFTVNGAQVSAMPVFTGIDGVVNTTLTSPALPGAAGVWSPMGTAPLKFNGTAWDRDFTCPSSAIVNVTAAATTELVALTASQIIRVCSIALTISLAGTAQFVYGTGTNCATGQTALTGAFSLATGVPLTISTGIGSLFRGASANALCLTAVTGNVTGFVTYAKY